MTASTLAGSLRSSTARRWRSLRPRSRVALALLTVAVLIGGCSLLWSFFETLAGPGHLEDTWRHLAAGILARRPDVPELGTRGDDSMGRLRRSQAG